MADNPRRFMQVIHSFEHGGSERLACDLALRVDPGRLRASVCAVDSGGPLMEELRLASVPTFVMGREDRFDWRLIPRFHRLFRANRVDIVQTHHLKQLLYSALAARLSGARLFHVEHEYFSLTTTRARRRLRALARLCERVVAVGDEIRRFLLSTLALPASKVVVIRNGVDVARYRAGKLLSRVALRLPEGGRLIGHVARLDPDKDQATLLRALALIAGDHPDVRLVIVGSGPQESHLKELAQALGVQSAVHFLGLRRDVAELLPHFALFVLSSVREGLPLALLEAMACARPVVATSVGDIPTVLGGNGSGAVVPPGDPTRLGNAIARLLDRPEAAEVMGRAGRQLVETRYSLTETTRQYEALFESVEEGASR